MDTPMLHRLFRVLVPVVCAALLLGVCATTAEAWGLPRVLGVAKAGQDWKNAKLKIRWNQVRAAHYVLRLATTPQRIKHGRVVRSRSANGVYTPRLNRNATYYVQVRAIRGGARSRWSRITKVRFNRPRAAVVAHGSAAAPGTGPISYPSVAAMKASGRFHIPANANLVVWHFGNKTLEEAFMALGANDILVLPERSAPYFIDSSGGFRASGVASVLGRGGKRIPIVSTYKGKSARTWFAMARARRGILGMGPGAVITTTASGFRQEAQIPDKGSALPGGGTSPGRYYWTTSGALGHELVGSQEKVIETENANGETGAISINGGRYLISHVSTSPLDELGRRVGASPIMVNNSPGGRWEYGDASQARAGMPTIWHSSGRHEWYNITSRWGGPGVNLEQAMDGFEFVMTGGRLWPNRGGKGGHPSPDGLFQNAMHIHLHALGTATITLTDVDLDQSIQANKLCMQLYGSSTVPSKVKVTATNGGTSVPVAAYGAGGIVALAP